MDNLFYGLCRSIEIEGVEYEVNTDFSVWIEIEHIIFSRKYDELETLARIFALAFPVLPPNPKAALDGLLWFYSAGKTGRKDALCAKPAYDLVLDFEYVWGAFLAEFGIDLVESGMHWWKFKALLACLSGECRFSQIVGYRTADLSQIKDEARRSFYRKMKQRFRLLDNRTDDEKESETAEKLETFFLA